jgi:hypothetical protein
MVWRLWTLTFPNIHMFWNVNVDLEPTDTFHISTTPFWTLGIIRDIVEPIQAFQTTFGASPLSYLCIILMFKIR